MLLAFVVQIGALSFGAEFCGENPKYPGVYSSIPHYRKWIDQILGI